MTSKRAWQSRVRVPLRPSGVKAKAMSFQVVRVSGRVKVKTALPFSRRFCGAQSAVLAKSVRMRGGGVGAATFLLADFRAP